MPSRKHAAKTPAPKARSAVRHIIRHHFGSPPGSISRETGGLSNLVFNVEHHEEEFIVRINPERAKLNL